ncbi:protein phosphatase 2C domain-containing protein [Corynebacterium sp. H128]|uniref:PP2C family protein-serine/threonine phosphatase n=1 Tax=Corynebacterium sp. H128 TaxID=3133427 RepID=UPI00309AC0EA
MLKLNYTVASDRGLVRGNNEDSAYAGPYLLALADGMGGHAAGEVASQLMIDHLRALDADPADNDMLALLGSVADDANMSIAERIKSNPETAGMGTTCTTLMFDGTQFGMLHVGDSRGYRLRDGKLERITRDDTYVQSLVDEGSLDAEDISTHPQRSLILKAYTGHPVEPTLGMLDAKVGDRILLCSDGLSDPVTHSTIETALAEGTPREAAVRLIELALRSGGPDNVTVVIADVIDSEAYDGPALPITPMTAGALNAGDPEDPRPNTAAGRAATMVERAKQERQPQTISPSGEVTNQLTEIPEAARQKRRKPWLGLLIAIIVLALLAAAGWFALEKGKENFYVNTDEHEQIVIEQGFNTSLFGKDLHSVYQQACLDKDAKLKVVNQGAADCTPFVVNDLKPDARSSLSSMPSGNYDEVMQQVTRLSGELLPECIKRDNANPDESLAGDLNTPGVNCREVAK